MTDFPRNIHSKLKYYIYLYLYPRDDEIFYVGKGVGNRAFSHLKDDSEKEKSQRIKEIRKAGAEPRIEILVHGIESDETAKKIEASVIDLIGTEQLTNIVRGYESREFGRMTLEQIAATYSAAKADIKDPCLLININRSFRYGMSAVELYDATRSAWKIGGQKAEVRFALAVYHSIVQEVYEILGWFPGGSTFNTRTLGQVRDRSDRWEFIGGIAGADVRKRYLYTDVSDHLGTQNPIRYVMP